MVAMVRYSSQAGCQAQHAIGSPTVCYLCLSCFLSPLYVSIPLFVRLSFAASYSPFRPSRFHPRVPCVSLLSHDSRDGDVTSSMREEKFREGWKSEGGEMESDCRGKNFFPLFNSASSGS